MSESRSERLVGRSVLSDETYAVIRDLVLEHELPPGARVNIDALSARLGVSPTPVREALARLESDGLVVKQPLRGYSTTPLVTPREFGELIQFRVLIEQWTAEQAAATIEPGAAAELRRELDHAHQATAAGQSDAAMFRELAEHDQRFHRTIAHLAGNELIAQSFERTHFHLHFLRLYLASRSTDPRDPAAAERVRLMLEEYDRTNEVTRTLRDHAAIAEAVIAGDGASAARLMREHIEMSRRRFLPIVELLDDLG